jgi:metal-dependent amidase/aminoacylase/carboxypeptidase family protein
VADIVVATLKASGVQRVYGIPGDSLNGFTDALRRPFMATEDSINVTVYGKGGHGAMPQHTIDPVVLAAMIIVRLQAIVSRETPPGEIAVVTVGSFPLTVKDPATTDRVAAAFATHFGGHALEIDQQTVSEDFSNIPNAAGVPYTYWGLGFTDEKTYRAAEKAGRLQDLPTNHSPKFLPPLQPTLRTGTEALVTAALAWLEPR